MSPLLRAPNSSYEPKWTTCSIGLAPFGHYEPSEVTAQLG